MLLCRNCCCCCARVVVQKKEKCSCYLFIIIIIIVRFEWPRYSTGFPIIKLVFVLYVHKMLNRGAKQITIIIRIIITKITKIINLILRAPRGASEAPKHTT